MPWRRIRAALEHAYDTIGETHADHLPKRDWNLVEAAIKFDREGHRKTCIECREIIPLWEEIKCLDCKGYLHENCAPHHFGRKPK